MAVFCAQFLVFSSVLAQTAGEVGREPAQIINPIGGTEKNPIGATTPTVIIAGVIGKVLGIMGSVTLLVFVYGGFQWLTSAGNQEKVGKGSKTMLYAAIGLAVIFSSYAMLNLLIKFLEG